MASALIIEDFSWNICMLVSTNVFHWRTVCCRCSARWTSWEMFRGGCQVFKKKKKKDIRISKLKIECRPTKRIFEYSGPALKSSLFKSSHVCSSEVSVWIMFGFWITFVNKAALRFSLCSPPVDCLLQQGVFIVHQTLICQQIKGILISQLMTPLNHLSSLFWCSFELQQIVLTT